MGTLNNLETNLGRFGGGWGGGQDWRDSQSSAIRSPDVSSVPGGPVPSPPAPKPPVPMEEAPTEATEAPAPARGSPPGARGHSPWCHCRRSGCSSDASFSLRFGAWVVVLLLFFKCLEGGEGFGLARIWKWLFFAVFGLGARQL